RGLASLERPTQDDAGLRRSRSRGAIGRQGGGVIDVRCYPHAVAISATSEIGKCVHKRPTNSSVPVLRIDAQLIQEHLRAFVWMGCFHTTNEADGLVAVVNGDQQVVGLARQ